MTRWKINVMALAVTLMGAASFAMPSSASATEELRVCCPSSAGSCCGDECKADSNGSCSACSGWRCIFF